MHIYNVLTLRVPIKRMNRGDIGAIMMSCNNENCSFKNLCPPTRRMENALCIVRIWKSRKRAGKSKRGEKRAAILFSSFVFLILDEVNFPHRARLRGKGGNNTVARKSK